jgi:beta-galactosidase
MLEIKEDGKTILNKLVGGIDVPPAAEVTFDISPWLPKMKPNAEYYARMYFVLTKDETWASKGFEVASNQLKIANAEKQVTQQNFTAPLSLEEDETHIRLKGKNFKIAFSKVTGALSSYVQNTQELVLSPLLPRFTRPQTDNDRRGWKTHRVLKQWYDASLKLANITTGKFDGKKGSGILITSNYTLIHDSARVTVSYEVYGNGVIHINYDLNPDAGLPNIPKVGMQMGIAKNFDQVQWYGRGPFENYIDRRYAADAGIYNFPIGEMMENYVVPQENGNRTDVRWMYLASPGSKDGLLIVADSLLSMGASRFTDENIQAAKHTNKLKDAGYITLNIDLIQMGVGGNDSWSDVAAPLEQYQVKAQPYHYSFYIVPFNSKNKTASEQAKEIKFK